MSIIKELINDATGNFSIEVREDNMYLDVAEKSTELNVTFNAVKKLLTEMDASNIDEKAIARAIENKESIIVAQIAKPQLDIYIEDEDMKAAVLIKGSVKYKNFTKEEVFQKLKLAGVTAGIDEAGIEKAIANAGHRQTIAIGKKATDGKDAIISFKKDIAGERGKPKELEGGRVDYKDLDLFLAVTENEIIAEKTPATAGEEGYTVKGKMLKAFPGKDKRIKTGKNVLVEDNIYIAKISGHLQITNDKIEVLPVLQLNGDIDLSTGNITFPGDVNVKGSVQSGFFIKAEGTVTIQGSIQGGSVEGKVIDVKQGIQGAVGSYVKAQERVVAKFIENATVYADDIIMVADSVLHSKLSAGHKVIITGSKGIIAGGRVSAGEEIDAKNVGTQMAPPTIIEVGVNPSLKEEFIKLKDLYREATVKQESVKKSLLIIKPDENAVVPENRQELYIKLTRANFTLLGEIDEMKKRLIYIEEEFSKLSNGKIKCGGSIYPGVKLIINNIVYPIRDILQFAVFYVEDAEVRFSNYS